MQNAVSMLMVIELNFIDHLPHIDHSKRHSSLSPHPHHHHHQLHQHRTIKFIIAQRGIQIQHKNNLQIIMIFMVVFMELSRNLFFQDIGAMDGEWSTPNSFM